LSQTKATIMRVGLLALLMIAFGAGIFDMQAFGFGIPAAVAGSRENPVSHLFGSPAGCLPGHTP
jgi:hypothetical protein